MIKSAIKLQVLYDLPRFITVWEDTLATHSSDVDEYTTVEAGATLELVRKFTRPNDNQTFLECSNGETLIAFNDQERLNCTAIDDPKQYNLFELVRSKLLPRFIQFDEVDLNEITHLDDTLHNETITAVDHPMELLGFTDIEMLVGYIRNESNETYETILIPWDLWTSLFVHAECSGNKEKSQGHIARLYGPVGEVDFIEKSLYLLPIHQRHVVSLIGPDFRRQCNYSSTNSVDTDPDGVNEMMYRGPVVLLPQVKKKKTLFKKVHGELLRLFKSNNDEKAAFIHLKKRPIAERKVTRRYTKESQDSFSRSAPLIETRHEPIRLRYTRKLYGNASYLEFSDDNSVGRLSGNKPMQLRLSVSLGDLPNATCPPTNSNSNNTYDVNPSSSKEYAEILDIPQPSEEIIAYNTPLSGRQRRQQHIPLFASSSDPILPTAQISVSWGGHSRNEEQCENQELFYSYNVAQTYHCFKDCGLEDFAMKCKKNKLDGSFFRNFDCSVLKGEPFNLSNFTLMKIRKIIIDGWRPT